MSVPIKRSMPSSWVGKSAHITFETLRLFYGRSIIAPAQGQWELRRASASQTSRLIYSAGAGSVPSLTNVAVLNADLGVSMYHGLFVTCRILTLSTRSRDLWCYCSTIFWFFFNDDLLNWSVFCESWFIFTGFKHINFNRRKVLLRPLFW